MFIFAANPLDPLIDFFGWILTSFHDGVGLGWGASIIAMTLVVRAALLPLTLKQFKSMQAMARHQPELKRLQEKYKGDRDRMNQEMMKFYRENKINPLASCLPLIAQLPVFIALFYLLKDDLRRDICPSVNPPSVEKPRPCGQTEASEFFFIPDLTNKATGAVLIALIAMYVGSQLLSTMLSAVSADRNQRILMYALPFFFVLFVWQFPAGLLVYWITTNVWTIVQQAIVRRRLGPLRPPPEPGSENGKGSGGGLGGLLHRSSPEPVAVKAPARPTAPPPSPPRKKKKRSGRRR